jgi:hypothetical protein
MRLTTETAPVAVERPRPLAAPTFTRLEGRLTQIDCLGDSARLRIDQPNGKTFLLVRDPRSISLKNAGGISFEFSCGEVEPQQVAIEFVPGRNETYGTAGEIRSIEFR